MNPTLLIALDGATATVLKPLMENGVMPFLKEFIGSGVQGTLMSTAHPLTPPAFVSMVTGRSPGCHGIFDFYRPKDKGSEVLFTFYDSRDIRCETIWSIASRQNRKVAALNFVLTTPCTPEHGILVPGMTHWKHLRRNTHPRRFYEKLTSLSWFDRKTLCWDFRGMEDVGGDSPDDYRQWVRHSIAREIQWFQVLRYLMTEEPTDLISIVFDGVDKIQHLCWVFLDSTLFPEKPEPWEVEIRDLCYEYFHQLDRFIREFVERAGSSARVFIVSDHGFGPTHVTLSLNQFLKNLGHLHWREENRTNGNSKEGVSLSLGLNLDWKKTVAYCPTKSSNGIFIRVARKPGEVGISPDQYYPFREKLVAELKTLREPNTGQRLIKEILLKEEVFAGPAMDDAPDITVILCDYGLVSTVPCDSLVVEKPLIRGTHYPEGIFLAVGEGIKKGYTLPRPLSMLDVAPTILYSLGLSIPQNFEGSLAVNAFEEGFIKENPIALGKPAGEITDEPTASPESGQKIRTEEEEEALYAQLRALGYME